MTHETVDCFNCGRPNPEWAQVCRSCGVALRHGEARVVPTGPLPTDRNSLISMGAVIATILGAVLLGLFVSGLNPTGDTVAQATPSPTVSTPVSTPAPPPPSPTPSAAPTATPTAEPELRGRLVFGTGLNEDRGVTGRTGTFTPADNFAYSLRVRGGVGGTPIRNVVQRVSDPAETVIEGDEIDVDPESARIGFDLGPASQFISEWGPGEYLWQVFVGEELVAERTFRLAEG